jgi:hypothetical protein
MELLSLDSAHLAEYVDHQSKLIRLEGQFVVFTLNLQNQERPKKFKENVSFERMLPMLNVLS